MHQHGKNVLARNVFIIVMAIAALAVPKGSAVSRGSEARLTPNHPVAVKPLELRRAPTTDELMAAGQFGGPLFPTHEAKDASRDESGRWAFGKAIEEWNKHEYRKAIGMFRQYLNEYPDSPWAAEAELHIGCDASYNGRYSEAEAIFEKLIADHQGKEHAGAKMLLNKARQRLALLKVQQNNLDLASLHFRALLQESPDWRHRTYASHWIQRLSRYAAAKQALVNCGAEALAYALERDGRHAAAAQVRTNLPATIKGHSLASLAGLAAREGLELTALQLGPGDLPRVPLPAILRITPQSGGDKGHYWVLDKVEGQRVELFDPQSEHRYGQSVEELAREWSGQCLVFAKQGPLPGRKLELQEMEEASGGCCGVPAKEDDQGDPCRNGSSGGSGCSGCAAGAPIWSVNMVNMNLYVTDVPMWYVPPIGPPVTISLSYNSQSAIALNEPFGNKWQFKYSSYLVVDTADTVTLFMPDGRRDTYVPDGFGGYTKPYQVKNTLTKLGPNWFSLRFPDGTVYIYQVPLGSASQQPMLVEIRDSWDQRISLGYDFEVRLSTITDAQGLVTRLTYGANGLVSTVTDPFGRQATFQYDAARNLTRITDMGGYWSSFTYDANVYLTSIGNERGTWTFRIEAADGVGNGSNPYPMPGSAMWENYRITVTDPLGRASEYQYNGYSSYAWHVAPRDYVAWQSEYDNNFKDGVRKTTYHYAQMDSGRRGELSQITYPEGDYIKYGYDILTGDQTSRTDAHGHTVRFACNAMGEVTWIKNAKGTVTTLGYAANGVDLVSISDGLGQSTSTYDNHHRVLSALDSLGNQTSYAYNEYGQMISRVDALGVANEYLYDASHRLSQVKRAGQVIQTLDYDSLGRVRSRTDATGLTLTYSYNNLDQVTRVAFPDGKSINYAYSSCCPRLLDSVTDRAGSTTRFAYDALKQRTQVVSPDGGVTQFGYDANGNQISLTDPNGNITKFAYDLDDRLVKQTYPDGKSTTYTYDMAGLLLNRIDARGVVTTYGYDTTHFLTSILYSDGTPSVATSYDSFGRLLTIQDGIGTHSFIHDADSRVTSYDGPWANDLITYGYDAIGQLTNVLVQGSPAIRYARDSLGRLTGVGVGASTYLYDYAGAGGMVQQLTRPNGSFTTCQYDNVNRVTAVSNRRSTGTAISQFVRAFDAQDRCSAETVSNSLAFAVSSNTLTVGSFNQLNQLSNSSPPARQFAFDADGNLTRGFTPQGFAFTASYDAENRLRSLTYTNAGGQVRRLEYAYSGFGLLAEVREYSNEILTNGIRYLRDSESALQERDQSDSVIRTYAWGRSLGGGVGGLLDVAQGGQNYAPLYDARGNVVGLLDAAQSLASAYAYDPFGQLLAQSGSLDQPMRFSTMPYDPNTGLIHFPYRCYSPSLGRWLTRDPLGEDASPNLYAYVGNNPVQRIDPSGLYWAEGPVDRSSGGAATIVCNGKGGIRTEWLLPPKDVKNIIPCIKECVEQHEADHAKAVRKDAKGKSICKGKKDGTQIWMTDKERATGEVAAHQVEIDCLKKAVNEGKCTKEDVESRLERVAKSQQEWSREKLKFTLDSLNL